MLWNRNCYINHVMEFYIFTISDIYVILLYVVLFWVVERFPRNFLVLIWSSIWPCFFDGIIQHLKHICNVALLRLLEKTLMVGVYTTKSRLLFISKTTSQRKIDCLHMVLQFNLSLFNFSYVHTQNILGTRNCATGLFSRMSFISFIFFPVESICRHLDICPDILDGM